MTRFTNYFTAIVAAIALSFFSLHAVVTVPVAQTIAISAPIFA